MSLPTKNSGECVIFDPGCSIEDANPAFCELVGYTLDELRGMHAWDIDGSGEELVRKRLTRVAQQMSMSASSQGPASKTRAASSSPGRAT